MKRLFAVLLCCAAIASCTKNETHIELTVSAASSLTNAMEEAKQAYEISNPNIRLFINYGSSGSLQNQIEEGAPVDVFVSAAPRQIEELDRKSLLNSATISELFWNKVVLVVPQGSSLSGFDGLKEQAVSKFAIGDPASVPAGQYGMQVLQNLKLVEALQGRIVYAKDVREVLSWVESGNADAGIVYKTDAMISKKVSIAAEAPAGSHKAVLYPGAVIKKSAHQAEANDFLNWLATGKTTRPIFEKYGFAPAG